MKNFLKWCLTATVIMLCVVGIHSMSASAEQQATEEPQLAPANPDSTTKWEGEPIIVDTAEPASKARTLTASSAKNPVIIDISHHQGNIDWAKASKVVDLAIIRTQYGSQLEDRQHKAYSAGAKKYGVPFGVYAYNLATDVADAKVEARDFYNRADKSAKFYVIDVEEVTGKNAASMRGIINSYVAELRKLTDKKIGIYIAHHEYKAYDLDMSKADFVWIPRYGSKKPDFAHELWQYTDSGKVSGISTYVDLNKLASGVSLDYFTKGVGQVSDKVSYYDENPLKVAMKKAVPEYSSTTITDANKVSTNAKNKIVDVTSIVKSSKGVPLLKLKNGHYMSANKKDSVKLRSDSANYLTDLPKTVLLKNKQTAYKSTNFVAANAVREYNANTILTIKDIDYTSGGTPRLKTSAGTYISAHKNHTRKVLNSINNYLYTNPGYVLTKTKVYVYSTPNFEKRTGKSYEIGQKLKVTAIDWSDSGVPRLQVGKGQYMTANKVSVQKVREDIEKYWTEVPKKAMLLKAQSSYNSTTFGTSNKVKNYSANAVFTIASIEYTSAGTPRFKTSTGVYLSANKANTQKVLSSIKGYLYINPKHVMITKAVNEYTTAEAVNKTGKTYQVGEFVKVKAIEFTQSGVPRLKIAENQYVTANKINVQKVSTAIENYYYKNPTKVVSLQSIPVYTSVDMTKKTGKLYKKGATIKVQSISWTASGTPRLKLATGQYISAKLMYYK